MNTPATFFQRTPPDARQWCVVRGQDSYQEMYPAQNFEELQAWVRHGFVVGSDLVFDPRDQRWYFATNMIELGSPPWPHHQPSFLERPIGRELAGLGLMSALIIVLGAIAYWSWMTFVARAPERDPASIHQYQSARETVQTLAIINFSATVIRVEQRVDHSLDVYMAKSDFEHVLYPDREDAIRHIAPPWCATVDHLFLPVVLIRDIHSGEQLASYNCTTSRVLVK